MSIEIGFALEIKDLKFAYKKDLVLRGVDVSAGVGETICLLGENGAGKTTLFRCVLGLRDGYEGEIRLFGKDSRFLSIPERAKMVAYIPQAHSPMFNYTVFETVLMGTNVLRNKMRSPGQREHEIAREKLELLNITHLAGRGYAEISGGERQLALIARALAQNSRILIMDEPTANLDYGNQLRVMRQVKQLARQGYLVVLSTHNPEHALLYADKVLIIKNGVAATYGSPQKEMTAELIKSLYDVTVKIADVQAPWGQVPMVVPKIDL